MAPISPILIFSLLLLTSPALSDHSPAHSPSEPPHPPAADAISPPPASASPAPSPSPSFSSPPAPPPSDLNSDSPSPSPTPAPSPSPTADEDSPPKSPSPAPAADGGDIKRESQPNAVDLNGKGDSSGGMNQGQKAGVAVGVIAGACVVGAGVVVYKKRQQNIQRSQYGYAARREIL